MAALGNDDRKVRLNTIWKEVLGLNEISESDNFFELGGDSIQAVIAISAIQSELGVDIPLQIIFASQTMGELNRYVLEL